MVVRFSSEEDNSECLSDYCIDLGSTENPVLLERKTRPGPVNMSPTRAEYSMYL